MSPFFLIIAFFICLVSCRNKEQIQLISVIDDTVSVNHIKTADSLDLDASPFITADFPDTVKAILYGSDDSAWRCITAFYLSNLTRARAMDSFTKVMMATRFRKDSTERGTRFWKSNYNRRFGVELQGDSIDTIWAIHQLWYGGHKYELVTRKYKYWQHRDSARYKLTKGLVVVQ